MTGCQLFRWSPSTQGTPCQVMNQVRLAPWSGLLRATFFLLVGKSAHLCCLRKNSQGKSSLPFLVSRHTSSVTTINEGCDKSDGAPDKCLPERGNAHFKRQKEAGFEHLSFVTFERKRDTFSPTASQSLHV